ncbi:trypsin Inhibitor like cysteine rich domain protein [Oesophagostomum dentatum]|uniref:Trypsin Inhibitor like cysteine rich domain protein n=1 Tax=Oesophagostomum dentatum TaxID=61180 RepID=A0A0B1T3A1_OESDE|nr:trypsin Inhibitor like cysteine rich domain protein [Oesophagostomum dentatum]
MNHCDLLILWRDPNRFVVLTYFPASTKHSVVKIIFAALCKHYFVQGILSACGDDEVVNQCGNECEPGCENAFGEPKICIEVCYPPACVCKPNLYRRNGKCVTKSQCRKCFFLKA